MNPVETVTSGPIALALAVAAAAGILSFASPCMLPLVPGYISYVTGMTGVDLKNPDKPRWRVLTGTVLFIAGFTTIFVLIGATIGGVGTWLLVHERPVEIGIGIVTILLGVVYLGIIPATQREWRLNATPTAGLLGAPLLGAVFALSWVPCLSPTLAAVQGLAFLEGGAQRGALLSVAYALGLGLPFLLLSAGVRWAAGVVHLLRAHARTVQMAGGVLLITLGITLVTGLWGVFTNWLRATVGTGQISL